MKRIFIYTSALALSATLSLAADQIDFKPCDWKPPCVDRTWTMTNSFGVGYRRDRQRLHEPTYTAYLDNFNSTTMQYQMIFAWERLILRLSADYGWLVSGNLSYKGLKTPFQTTEQDFGTFSISSGYNVDVLPAIACRIVFWHIGCKGCLSFIPALGYTYSHFNAVPQGRKESTPPGLNGFTTLEFIRPIQQDWYGPTMEGRIGFSWDKAWHFDVFYQYTHLNFRQTFSQSVSNFFLNGGGTVNTSTIRFSSKGTSFRTQLGGADFSYRSPCNWQLGSHFEGSATWSNTGKSIVRTVRDIFVPASPETRSTSTEQLSLHWTRYLVNFYGSYWF